MANQIPLSGATDAAGGYILPEAQGAILAEGLLRESGALSLAGDARATSSRKETFAIWKGRPTAEFVGEGGTKPVTGAEFGAGTLNIKKVATIVTFTDEMLEDVQSGDLNVLVDGDIRGAISDKIDQHAVGIGVSGEFDTELVQTTSVVNWDANSSDSLRKAVSAAMGTLEANGYRDFGVLIPGDVQRHIRDARAQVPAGGGTVAVATATTDQLYDQTTDPLYGLPRAVSTNLSPVSGAGTVAIVVARPNLHVRVRKDVVVTPSREASLAIGDEVKSLYQEDLTAARYVTRLGFWAHDVNRAVVKIVKS